MHRRSDPGLRVIGLFKLGKAALLIALGVGAFRALDPQTGAAIRQYLADVADQTGREGIQQFVATVCGLDRRHVAALGIGATAYGMVFGVEGVGLWLGTRWGEYLSILATGGLIPFELYEVTRRFTALRFAALALNVLAVAYVVYRVRRPRDLAVPEPAG